MPDMKSVYSEHPAAIPGGIQVSCALLAIILEIIVLWQGSYICFSGILTEIIFAISGRLTIVRGKIGKKGHDDNLHGVLHNLLCAGGSLHHISL